VHSSRFTLPRPPAAVTVALAIAAASLAAGCDSSGKDQALKALDKGQKAIQKNLTKIEKHHGTPKEAKDLIDKARHQSRKQIEQGRNEVNQQP
jgi:F0F1-type ATP synthase membrane subunit b/b'